MSNPAAAAVESPLAVPATAYPDRQIPDRRHETAPEMRPAWMATGILSTVGDTPLVEMRRLFAGSGFRLHAKLEMANPGGSAKDRSALGMLLDGRERGEVGPHTTIIESSSGNLGIGLAQACAYLRLPFLCVVDRRTTANHIAIMRAFGARVEMVEVPAASGEGKREPDLLGARLERVRQLRRAIPDHYWVNQYGNLSNPRAHYGLCAEIFQSLGNRVDFLFAATSTCGTLRGCRDFVRRNGLSTRIVAVDAEGSVIFRDQSRPRLIPGHGSSRWPELYRPDLADACVHVSDRDAVAGCFRLAREEAVFAGGSSGAVAAAIGKFAGRIPAGSTVAAILCDRGDRYLDTVYSADWIGQHFGSDFRPWEDGGAVTAAAGGRQEEALGA